MGRSAGSDCRRERNLELPSLGERRVKSEKGRAMRKQKSMRCTARSARIQPFYVMELLEKAQAMEARGEKVVHMEIGEPDFTTPPLYKGSGREGHGGGAHLLHAQPRLARIKGAHRSPLRRITRRERAGRQDHRDERHVGRLFSAVLGASRSREGISSSPIPDTLVTGISAPSSTRASSPCPFPPHRGSRSRPARWKSAGAVAAPLHAVQPLPTRPGLSTRPNPWRVFMTPCRRRAACMAVDEIYSGLTYDRHYPSALADIGRYRRHRRFLKDLRDDRLEARMDGRAPRRSCGPCRGWRRTYSFRPPRSPSMRPLPRSTRRPRSRR